MTREITYKGIDWEIGYDRDDALTDIYTTDIYITSVKMPGSDVDIYDHLLDSTLDGLYEALEESFK